MSSFSIKVLLEYFFPGMFVLIGIVLLFGNYTSDLSAIVYYINKIVDDGNKGGSGWLIIIGFIGVLFISYFIGIILNGFSNFFIRVFISPYRMKRIKKRIFLEGNKNVNYLCPNYSKKKINKDKINCIKCAIANCDVKDLINFLEPVFLIQSSNEERKPDKNLNQPKKIRNPELTEERYVKYLFFPVFLLIDVIKFCFFLFKKTSFKNEFVFNYFPSIYSLGLFFKDLKDYFIDLHKNYKVLKMYSFIYTTVRNYVSTLSEYCAKAIDYHWSMLRMSRASIFPLLFLLGILYFLEKKSALQGINYYPYFLIVLFLNIVNFLNYIYRERFLIHTTFDMAFFSKDSKFKGLMMAMQQRLNNN